jgi:hypothetical protein
MIGTKNIPFSYYELISYQMAIIINKVNKIFVFSTYLIYLIGIFVNKIITAELFCLWQVGYFSLSSIWQINPVLYYDNDAYLSNGINVLKNYDNRELP